MGLIPSTVIPAGTTIGGDPASTIVVVKDFLGEVDCQTDKGATAVATAEWSAELYYWADPTNDEIRNGTYVNIELGSDNGTADPLASINATGNNPMVIEFPDTGPSPDPLGHPNDVHLFPLTHTHGAGEHTHAGFLDPARGWSSTSDQEEEESPDGRIARAGISQALQLRTVPLDSGTSDSFLTVSVGAVNCSAEDQR